MIESYYQYLQERGLSSTTIQNHHMLLQGIFREACKREIILRSPIEFVTKPKRQRPKVNCYSKQEARQLLEAVKGTKLELVVTLTLADGLCRSEVLGLRWQDVDFEKQTILICHSVIDGIDDGKRVVCQRDVLKQAAFYRTLPLFEPITSLLQEEWERKKEMLPT